MGPARRARLRRAAAPTTARPANISASISGSVRYRGGHIAGAHSHGRQHTVLVEVGLLAEVGDEDPREVQQQRVPRTEPVNIGLPSSA